MFIKITPLNDRQSIQQQRSDPEVLSERILPKESILEVRVNNTCAQHSTITYKVYTTSGDRDGRCKRNYFEQRDLHVLENIDQVYDRLKN